MSPKEKIIAALERKPLRGRVPHFELVFFLTMEAFGKVHPAQRKYNQWDQMSETERELHRREIAEIHLRTAQTFEHSAIFVHPNPHTAKESMRQLELITEKADQDYFFMVHGDATYGIPSGSGMAEFSYRMVDEPEALKDQAKRMVENSLKRAEQYKSHGLLDGFALCSDYCLNTGPFLSPDQFAEFVAPYLKALIKGYRDLGFYTIKHTDGNIMPILDQLVDTQPHALHSLDPQAGIDIKEVKNKVGHRVCLIGNVNCGLLDTGTEKEVVDSARYALKNGMPKYGYIFSTSNCIYTGMSLTRYKKMLEVWKEEGHYD